MLGKALTLSAAGGEAGPEWNVENAVFNGTPVPLGPTVSNPKGLYFSPDGTRLYTTQATSDVRQYDLSVAWDANSFAFVRSVNSSVTGVSDPLGIFFKSDGTKLFLMKSGSIIHELNLSTAWDISTASAVTTFDASTQTNGGWALFFKDDGTKMYVTAANGGDVVEYSLSTAWDISSSSYVRTKDISAQITGPVGLWFSSTGTKMYASGASNKAYEYTLSTAFNISTASSTNNITVTEPTPHIFLKSNGTQLYVIGSSRDRMEVYTLATAYNLSTADFVFPTTNFFEPSEPVNCENQFFFKPDGTKLYIAERVSNEVHEYDLSVAWDLTTVSFVRSQTLTSGTNAQGLFFKDDGTKMYVADDHRYVREFSLSTAWNISTISFVGSLTVDTVGSYKNGMFFKPDGTKMYLVDDGTDRVYEWTLSTAWDITSGTYTTSGYIGPTYILGRGLFFKDDGTKMYVADYFRRAIAQFSLSSAWDVSSITFEKAFGTSFSLPSPYHVFFKDDGSKMYVGGYSISQTTSPSYSGIISYDLQ